MKKIIRKWRHTDIREFCIKNKFYHEGDNEAYIKLLDFVKANDATDENIINVVTDIWDHSEGRINELMYMYGALEDEIFGHIVSELVKECTWVEVVEA